MRLSDSLLAQAKREAARRNRTLTSLIERGLRMVLAEQRSVRRKHRVSLPECRAGGGTLAGVDLNDSAALLDLMEGRP